jgi:hypothetical protein
MEIPNLTRFVWLLNYRPVGSQVRKTRLANKHALAATTDIRIPVPDMCKRPAQKHFNSTESERLTRLKIGAGAQTSSAGLLKRKDA